MPDIRSLTRRFPRLKGIMIGRGLLSSPWLATEYISDTPLTAQEKIEKLSAFHTLLLAGYSFRLEGGEHQVLDKMKTLGITCCRMQRNGSGKNIEKFPVGRLSRGSAEFDLRHLDHCRAMIRMNSLI